MTFTNEMCNRLLSDSSKMGEDPYGIQYTFTLQDKPDAAAVDAPEWIVPLGPPLDALAEAHDLRVEKVANFQDMVSDMMSTDRSKMDK
jgi:hypothetical protein